MSYLFFSPPYHQLLIPASNFIFFSILYSLIVLPISRFQLATFSSSFDLLLFFGLTAAPLLSLLYYLLLLFDLLLFFDLLVFLASLNCPLFYTWVIGYDELSLLLKTLKTGLGFDFVTRSSHSS